MRQRASSLPQFSTTKILCKRLSISTCDIYVLSHSRQRHRRLPNIIGKNTRKKEPEQSERLVDFGGSQG
jgi:hypothetical protein